MSWLRWLFVEPGNLLSDVLGTRDEHERGMVRMLVNMLVWTTVGASVFFAIAILHR